MSEIPKPALLFFGLLLVITIGNVYLESQVQDDTAYTCECTRVDHALRE